MIQRATLDILGPLKAMLTRNGIHVQERSEFERWGRVEAFIRDRFRFTEPLGRELFPRELSDYEVLIDWAGHCRNCSNPALCPHYGYQGEIQLRNYWMGRYFPSGVFLPEYYGGKCGAYLDAKKEKDKPTVATSPTGSGFRF